MNCSQLKFISGRNVQKNSSRASFVRCESSFLIQWHRTWVGWFLMHYHFWEKEKVGQISVLCGRFLENSWKSCSFSRKSWFGLRIIEKRGSLRLKQLINPLPWMCEFLWELEVAAFNLFLFFLMSPFREGLEKSVNIILWSWALCSFTHIYPWVVLSIRVEGSEKQRGFFSH